jgi:hypothetical protein
MFCTLSLVHVRSNYFERLLFAHACYPIENGEQIKQNWLLCDATKEACRASASAVCFIKTSLLQRKFTKVVVERT